jgi:hypothetical protein
MARKKSKAVLWLKRETGWGTVLRQYFFDNVGISVYSFAVEHLKHAN